MVGTKFNSLLPQIRVLIPKKYHKLLMILMYMSFNIMEFRFKN